MDNLLIMRNKELELIKSYIETNKNLLADNLHQVQNRMRYHHIDQADCLEFLCAKTEYDTFSNVCRDIITLLNLSGEISVD